MWLFNFDENLSMNWQETDDSLYRKFEFKDFSEAFAFMTRVALIAEKMDHHPKWTNVWNTVEVWLSTHDAGDIVTDKDRRLAEKIDALV
jgi:4a-hydroxytetrahydrobiopterin dehydratase